MTEQVNDLFEYNTEDYNLVGWSGGDLPKAEDFGMKFSACSAVNYAGYTMVYGIDANNILVVLRIIVCGEEIAPITHSHTITITPDVEYYDNLNRQIPLTGYIMFSEITKFYMIVEQAENLPPIFEAQVFEGTVLSITDVSKRIAQNVKKHGVKYMDELHKGPYPDKASRIAAYQREWDYTAAILGRRYDTLKGFATYKSFPNVIANPPEAIEE